MKNSRMLKFSFLSTMMCMATVLANGQTTNNAASKKLNTINTAVPFLRIIPDARGGGMGDVGIAVTEDANATFYNASKLVFADKPMGMSASYNQWLAALVKDVYLADLSGYYQIDKLQCISSSLRFFSLGNIDFYTQNAEFNGSFHPREFAYDINYSRKLSKIFSTGLTLRYIYSNLASGQTVDGVPIKAANGMATDISFFLKKPMKLGTTKSVFTAGAVISNLGTKVTYTNAINKDYIPANLGVGAALKLDLDKYNQIQFALDMNKLLVPTPNDSTLAYKNLSPIQGALTSFTDAPGGFKEELNEIMDGLGIEYWYNQQFALRTGYFYEAPTKGNRQFLTVGVGVKYNVLGINFAYLVPTTRVKSPLDNTLRFSLLFDFNALKGDGSSAASGDKIN